jgi:hypothetical protein
MPSTHLLLLPLNILLICCCPDTHKNMLLLAMGVQSRALINNEAMLKWAVAERIHHAVLYFSLEIAREAILALAHCLSKLEIVDINPTPLMPDLRRLTDLRGLSFGMSVAHAPPLQLDLGGLQGCIQTLWVISCSGVGGPSNSPVLRSTTPFTQHRRSFC